MCLVACAPSLAFAGRRTSNVMSRHANCVTMANYSPSVNCRGPVQVSDRGVLKRASHHVFALYRPCAVGHAVSVESHAPRLARSGAPVLDVVTVLDRTGVLRLHVVNRDPARPQPCTISLHGFSVAESTGHILAGPSLTAFNDFDHPDTLLTRPLPIDATGPTFDFTLPPRSIVVLLPSPA